MVNLLSVGRSTADPAMDDWYIDGFPLARLMSRFDCEGPAPRGDGFLATRHPDDLRALLGRPAPSQLPARVPLYGCSRCGAIECGVFAVRVTYDRDKATVSWTDFAWEYGSDPAPGPSPDYAALPTITFDLVKYETVIRQLLH
ncbi:hypothetical protein [Kibdelosporangium phytohabitans]|uniref:Oxidoreductase n=1 Tax=Kibdelosporangium phytohabitans TaxID=860235 RepID=A0A0N9I7D1_9PSEU|nr:hypothetical protein [Kibdelosporangium phytohabitans]ALG10660.1 hypothetical protein AOZ06_30550 [Kibdelosporangium phytohabitans]MBE1461783.1 hypothetical protein [Kibdelosporangium phytohabitans]